MKLLDPKGFTFPELQAAHAKKFPNRLSLQEVRHRLYDLGNSLKRIRIPKPRRIRLGKRMIDATAEEVIAWGMVDVIEVGVEVARIFDFRLGDEIAKHFPNECGYCRKPTCICHTLKEKPSIRYILDFPPTWASQKGLGDFQNMLWQIYPKPKTREGLLALTLHLSEEIPELLRELDTDAPDVSKVILETTDVVEKPLDIASLLEIFLAPFIARRYNCAA